MVALQIRDVPESVRDELAARARARGQSLQTFLLGVVEEEAARSRNLAILERFANRRDGARLNPSDATGALHEARRAREDRGR